jgi:hypothetical protein
MTKVLTIVPRRDFLLLTGVRSGAFNQRASLDKVALSLGREVPSEPGQYLALDAVHMQLVDRIAAHPELASPKEAASLVRLHWGRILTLVQRAEWDRDKFFIHLAVGWFQYFDPEMNEIGVQSGLKPGSLLTYPGIVVFGGTLREIAEAEEHKRRDGVLRSLVVINMFGDVLAQVLRRATEHGIKLPKFTAEPDTPEEEAMLDEVTDLRKKAAARLRGRGKDRRVPQSMHVPEVV